MIRGSKRYVFGAFLLFCLHLLMNRGSTRYVFGALFSLEPRKRYTFLVLPAFIVFFEPKLA